MGEKALRRGGDEIQASSPQPAQKAPETAEILADFLRDIDDPRRAVEIDDRVTADTGRTNPNPGTKNTKGYTGLEGLLNYAYYQAGAVNQFDQIGHLLHFSLYNVFTGPCGNFSSGRDPQTGEPGVPAEGGGTTTNILEADNCVAWLGPNQPGINEDLGLPQVRPVGVPEGHPAPGGRRRALQPGRQRSGPRVRAGARRAPGAARAQRAQAARHDRRRRGGSRRRRTRRRRRRSRRLRRADPERHPRPDPRPAAAGARQPARRPPGPARRRRQPAAAVGGGSAGARPRPRRRRPATDDLLDFLFSS